MKLEKRSEGMPEEQPAQDPTAQSGGQKQKNKPVLVYILVLFIVAFLLMALSLLMHQRSNAEVIGKLSDSVTALQQVQALKDENLRLQEELTAAQKEKDALSVELSVLESQPRQAELKRHALENLYVLEQQYANGNYAACKEALEALDTGEGYWEYLPAEGEDNWEYADADIASPLQRYRELKEAVEAHESAN